MASSILAFIAAMQSRCVMASFFRSVSGQELRNGSGKQLKGGGGRGGGRGKGPSLLVCRPILLHWGHCDCQMQLRLQNQI
ncbi:MAG: hypothetical protein J3Q66DRAFT_347565 [Benniella sp.]|nr:MAG: hypothetical protein J3Q66DRAFT_347565 [Benniella sp.]